MVDNALNAVRVALPPTTAAAFASVILFETLLIRKPPRSSATSTAVWRGVFYPICILASSLLLESGIRIYANTTGRGERSDDALLISLLLDGVVWLSLILSLLVSTTLSWKAYASSTATSAALRLVAVVLTIATHRHITILALTAECLRIAVLVVVMATCTFAAYRVRPLTPKPETEPLLSGRNLVETVRTGDDPSASISDDTSMDPDDSDSDDEEIFSEKRQQLMQDKGGIFNYIREFKIFLPYIWPAKSLRLKAYFCLILVSIMAQRVVNVLYARQYGILIDHLYRLASTGGPVPWQDIFLWLFYEVLYSSSCGLPALDEVLETRISNWSRLNLQIAAFDHVMGLDMKWADNKDTGEVLKSVDQAGSLASLLRVIVYDTGPVVIDVTVALWYTYKLIDVYASIIVLYVGVAFMFVSYLISIAMRQARRKSAVESRSQSRLLYELLGSWSTISYFNRRQYEQRRVASTVKTSLASSQWDNDLSICLFAAQQMVEILGLLAESLLAAYRVVQGQIPVGNFLALEMYWETITTPLWVFGHSFRQISSDLIDAERLLQLFQETSSIKDGPRTMPQYIDGGLEFSHVTFGYEADAPVISDLSFSVRPGQTVAIVGETGSGKSTTLKLLMRFYDVSSGSITISGMDVRDVTVSSLREVFGFVPQNAVLFNESIMDNVRYGRLDATDDDVYAACRAAAIHDRILGFPKGYSTKVGERGVKLSGGELQRISIARVILKDPQIVLLDEATSALDTETEYRIQGALKTLAEGRTTIVIAHRLSTVVNADIIIVMDKGSIVERGTHEELLKQSGKYRDYWAKQSTAVAPLTED